MSEEAAQLPSLQTSPDVQLWTDDGGCLPVHATILELHSPLLAEGLRLAREDQILDEHQLLRNPQLDMPQLLDLLLVLYSPAVTQHMKGIGSLERLQGLAESASLLQCSNVLHLAEKALVKNRVLSGCNVVECSIWAGQLQLHVLENYCARLLFEANLCSDAIERSDGLPLSRVLKKVGLIYSMLWNETAYGSRKRINARFDSAAFAQKVSW